MESVKELQEKRKQVLIAQVKYNDGVKRMLADIKREIKEAKE